MTAIKERQHQLHQLVNHAPVFSPLHSKNNHSVSADDDFKTEPDVDILDKILKNKNMR